MENNVTPEIEVNKDAEDRFKAYAEKLKKQLEEKEDKE